MYGNALNLSTVESCAFQMSVPRRVTSSLVRICQHGISTSASTLVSFLTFLLASNRQAIYMPNYNLDIHHFYLPSYNHSLNDEASLHFFIHFCSFQAAANQCIPKPNTHYPGPQRIQCLGTSSSSAHQLVELITSIPQGLAILRTKDRLIRQSTHELARALSHSWWPFRGRNVQCGCGVICGRCRSE